MFKYYKDSGSQLCSYEHNMEWVKTASSNANNSFLGPCPSFPIYESSSIFHRCIPTTQQIPNIGNNVYTFTQQFLSDIYNTWPLILGMSLLAFSKYKTTDYFMKLTCALTSLIGKFKFSLLKWQMFFIKIFKTFR